MRHLVMSTFNIRARDFNCRQNVLLIVISAVNRLQLVHIVVTILIIVNNCWFYARITYCGHVYIKSRKWSFLLNLLSWALSFNQFCILIKLFSSSIWKYFNCIFLCYFSFEGILSERALIKSLNHEESGNFYFSLNKKLTTWNEFE